MLYPYGRDSKGAQEGSMIARSRNFPAPVSKPHCEIKLTFIWSRKAQNRESGRSQMKVMYARCFRRSWSSPKAKQEAQRNFRRREREVWCKDYISYASFRRSEWMCNRRWRLTTTVENILRSSHSFAILFVLLSDSRLYLSRVWLTWFTVRCNWRNSPSIISYNKRYFLLVDIVEASILNCLTRYLGCLGAGTIRPDLTRTDSTQAKGATMIKSSISGFTNEATAAEILDQLARPDRRWNTANHRWAFSFRLEGDTCIWDIQF